MTFWLPLILLESLTENIRTRKYIRKVEKNERKKNRFKVNKLFLYPISNLFHLFNFSI